MKGFLALKIEGKILQNWYQSRDVDHSKWHGKRRTNDKFKKKTFGVYGKIVGTTKLSRF